MAYMSNDKIISAKRESKYVEFKEKFDITQPQDWCEIIKDIIALANSGGGVILVGVDNKGIPTGWDSKALASLDSAHMTDKLAKYTGIQFDAFNILEVEKSGQLLVSIEIEGIFPPVVFTQPGTYDAGEGKQKSAFAKGTIYFRHGAKSEPATSDDLRELFEQQLQKVKRSWVGGIRKVVEAPMGHRIQVLPPEVTESSQPDATPIRIVDDPKAPAYRKIDPDSTHPHRLKEVVRLVNQKIDSKKEITPYDVQCVRKIYKVDRSAHSFYYKSKFASPQYSDSFIEWLVEQYKKDLLFFNKARGK